MLRDPGREQAHQADDREDHEADHGQPVVQELGQEPPATLRYSARNKLLEIRIQRDAAGLFGEVARSRFQALAAVLGVEPIVKPGG